MTDQQLTPDELYEQFFPPAGHVVAFDAEHEAEYARIFSGEAHGAESEPASPEPTPEPPAAADAEQLTASVVETRKAQIALAVFRAAGAAADPADLLDSASFMASIEDIDPDDSEAITAAITTAVASNPRLGAVPSRLPAPNPAQGSSGSGPTYDADDLEYSRYFPTN